MARNNTSHAVDKAFPAASQSKPTPNRIRELASSRAMLLGRWLCRRGFAASCSREMKLEANIAGRTTEVCHSQSGCGLIST